MSKKLSGPYQIPDPQGVSKPRAGAVKDGTDLATTQEVPQPPINPPAEHTEHTITGKVSSTDGRKSITRN